MGDATPSSTPVWWLETEAVLFDRLGSSRAGLSEARATQILVQIGPNLIKPKRETALLLEFLSRFRNPLVLLLIGASAIAAVTGDIKSFVVINTMVLLSVILDFIQEYRAANAAEALKKSVALRAMVLRDGAERSIPSADLVPGDIVSLSAGNLVPADGIVIEERDLFVNQGLLTGESFPVEKRAGITTEISSQLDSAVNAVFMGTSVITGSAKVLLTCTGAATALGDVSAAISSKHGIDALQMGTRRFGMLIMRLTFFLVLFVLLINTALHRPWLESFMFSIALAVGLTPELLPMIVSVTLSRGALRMSRKQVIVKRLAAIHDLGQMDILCTDKTGTLTEARIRLERHVDIQGDESERVVELAYINSHFETGLRNPLDEAILQHKEVDVSHWNKIDEVPFDFERRRVSVLVEHAKQRMLIVKGAPEDALRLCTRYENGDELVPLDNSARRAAMQLFDSLGRDGFRVLAIAWRDVPLDHPHAVVDDETELTFAGFAAFLDPPKLDAAAALNDLHQSGVAVKILTGDNELVTQHICSTLGMPITGVLLGSAIATLDDAALSVQAESANLFCRVTPAQKNRIVTLLRRRNHTVGYLGDGINDAPALHTADVGISVDSAADVAKDAADLILLEHSLDALREGVLEGRRTFSNIQKYLMMGTSSNFGNMFSMAGATIFLPFLPMTPIQILLNNLLYDISEVAIPFDDVEPADIAKPRAWNVDFIRNFMLVLGPVSSLFDFLTFYVLLVVLHADKALFQTGWFIESLATQVLVIFIIRTRENPLHSKPNPLLLLTSLTIVPLAVVLPLTPIGQYFGFVPPPPQFFVILLLMVIGYLILVEIVKRRFYRNNAISRDVGLLVSQAQLGTRRERSVRHL
jgi:P-type Mg2+ transporter